MIESLKENGIMLDICQWIVCPPVDFKLHILVNFLVAQDEVKLEIFCDKKFANAVLWLWMCKFLIVSLQVLYKVKNEWFTRFFKPKSKDIM